MTFSLLWLFIRILHLAFIIVLHELRTYAYKEKITSFTMEWCMILSHLNISVLLLFLKACLSLYLNTTLNTTSPRLTWAPRRTQTPRRDQPFLGCVLVCRLPEREWSGLVCWSSLRRKGRTYCRRHRRPDQRRRRDTRDTTVQTGRTKTVWQKGMLV